MTYFKHTLTIALVLSVTWNVYWMRKVKVLAYATYLQSDWVDDRVACLEGSAKACTAAKVSVKKYDDFLTKQGAWDTVGGK